MIDLRVILITWVVFLALKPVAQLRSWRDAISGALIASVLHTALPLVTTDQRVQMVLTAAVGVVVFVCFWLLRRGQRPSAS